MKTSLWGEEIHKLNNGLNTEFSWGLLPWYIFIYPAFVLSYKPYLLTEVSASQRQFKMVATIRLHDSYADWIAKTSKTRGRYHSKVGIVVQRGSIPEDLRF